MTTKSIQIAGMDLATPQSLAGDGKCREIINMRFRKGCWRPIPAKTVLQSSAFTVSGTPIVFDAIYLHDIEGGINSGQPNWIGYKLDTDHGDLYLINGTVATLIEGGLNTGTSNDFAINVTFLKHTMIVTTALGLFVYLYSEGVYSKIESLPVPDVELHKNTEHLPLFNPDSQQDPNWPSMRIDEDPDHPIMAEYVLGNYFAFLNHHSQVGGKLYGSIMYVAVYRMFDGSYIMPSIPKYFEIENGGTVCTFNRASSQNYYALMTLAVSSLKASISNTQYTSLTAIKDIIESVVIFATRPTPLHKIDDTTLTGTTLTFPGGDGNHRYTAFSTFFPINPDFQKLNESTGYFKIHEFNFEELVLATTPRTVQDVDTTNFYQNYATREALPTDQLSHQKIVARGVYTYNDRLHALNIKTIYGDGYVLFPKFRAGYDMGSTTVPGKITVWLKTSLGAAVVVSNVNIPSYRATEQGSAGPYADEAAALAALAVYSYSPPTNYVPGSGYVIKKEVIVSGLWDSSYKWYVVYRALTEDTTENYLVPSVIGYNDSRAYRMMITIDEGSMVLLDAKLKKNTGLNFAYYSNPTFNVVESTLNSNYREQSIVEGSLITTAVVPAPSSTPFDTNRIQVSEIQNPLVYPAKNSYQVGTGSIYAVMAGSEPMSTGQFGQFPLQVFTTKGVYTMEVGTGDVLYTNILPAAGEVANNAKNIISVAGGVLYSTDKGLFVLIGRVPHEISEIIEGIPEASLTGREEITTLLTDSKYTPGLSGAISDINFLTYLTGSSIGYDQLNKELIVTNSAKGYSYVYSFESEMWYKIKGSYSLLINNWPKLYGLTSTSVLDLSTEATTGYVEVMIITCAQSFEMPETYKKIDRAILRSKITTNTGKYAGFYFFASDDINTYRFETGRQVTGVGCNDMITQRSFGGAKYYAFVINGQMSIDSEIKEIDLTFEAKLNAKLR